MAKIALEQGQAPARRVLAQGEGWTAEDVVCTAGPRDRPFEERHPRVTIAIVAAGSFQYRTAGGRELMIPGSLLLGNAGQSFECGHEHGTGDRCISFQYDTEYFERLAADAGVRGGGRVFRMLRLPPARELAGVAARACAGLRWGAPWEELSVSLAARAAQLAGGVPGGEGDLPASSVARVTRAVRRIEERPDSELRLASLAREAGLSPFHFLRVFERLTGLAPHQYVLRRRLREAAVRLAAGDGAARVLDIGLDCGFGDISNFNRAFRAEFGVSPREYARKIARPGAKFAE